MDIQNLSTFYVYQVVNGKRSLDARVMFLPELLVWAAERWPEIEWGLKPLSILPDLVEAESGYVYEIDTTQ